jgi:hypothetical protein
METNAELRFDLGEQTPKRLKRQLSRLMGMTSAQMRKVASEALGAVGAHKDHFIVLAALDEFGPASQAAIADRVRIYRRAPDPADKRRNVITVTDAGARRLDELDRILDGVNERIMAPLDPDEREQLFALVGRLNAHLSAGG